MERVLSSMPFLTTALARQGSTLRSNIERASTEMATGRVQDTGRAVAGDFSALAGIDHSLARIRGYGAVTAELGLMGETMQAALGVVSEAATTLASNLMLGGTIVAEAQQSAIFAEGRRHFDTAVAALNTRVAERAVFGGTMAETLPLPDPETMLTALEAAIAGAATVQDAMTAIEGWFTGPTGYEAMYGGGAARGDLPVAPGETAGLPFTALDPAIRDSLVGLSAVALMDRGLFAGQVQARSDMGQAAAESLMSSAEGRSILSARIGTVQSRVSDALARNGAEETALGILRNTMTAADPYETAAELQDLQNRLESFYVITSRLSRLNLTEYLR